MEKKAKTQKEAVRQHLENYGHISSFEAFQNYYITRLAHLIYTLRKEGMNIDTINQPHTNRYGNTGTYAIYKLEA